MPLLTTFSWLIALLFAYFVLTIWMCRSDVNLEQQRRERRMRNLQRAGDDYSRTYHSVLLRHHDLRRQIREIRREDAEVLRYLAQLEHQLYLERVREKVNWQEEGF